MFIGFWFFMSSRSFRIASAALVVLIAGCGEPATEVAAYSWDPDARQFLKSYCTRCHQGDHSGGDYNIYAEVRDDADVMRCGLAARELPGCDPPMPKPRSFPTGPRPPEEEVDALIAWLEAGLP